LWDLSDRAAENGREPHHEEEHQQPSAKENKRSIMATAASSGKSAGIYVIDEGKKKRSGLQT